MTSSTLSRDNDQAHEHTLAFVLNSRFYRVGSEYYAQSMNIIELLLALRAELGRIVICVPTLGVEGVPAGMQPIPSELSVCELPYYRGNADLLFRAPILVPILVRRLLRALPAWDIVGGVAPSIFGIIALLLAASRRRRVFLYIRGNVLATLRLETQHQSWQRFLIPASLWPFDMVTRLLARAGASTFVVGPALAQRYPGPRVHVLFGYCRQAIAGPDVPAPLLGRSLARLIFVGRLSREKGADVLLHAVKLVLGSGRSVHLTIVGDGPEAGALRHLALELGIDDCVTFAGHVADPLLLRTLYLDAGVTVIPSRTEGIPQTLVEAMALGRVVIATSVGSIPIVLKDQQNGLVVPPEDAEALAHALLRVREDAVFATRLAEAAMAVGRTMTPEVQARRVLDALR